MTKPYIPNDKWSKRAAEEGFRARSVYKLQELDEKCHLLRSGMTVLDAGAAPGSWLQYVSKLLGPSGKVVGLDLKEIEHVAPNVHTFVCDMLDFVAVDAILMKLGITKVDLVLSDIAPNTSGVKDVDQWRSLELCRSVMSVAKKILKPHGVLVMKVLRGRDFDDFLSEVKSHFTQVRTITVQASRDRSREVYVDCSSR
jgi:23S rRNA (uridine2552-2'-O)-methyltransferase